MKRSRLTALALVAAAALTSAAPAEATFPGEVNGRIAWAGFHDGKRGIYTTMPDGSDLRQVLAGDAGQPAWAPHGEQLAFTSGGQIGIVGADGSGWTMLTDRSEVLVATEPSWSADGTKIVFLGMQWGASYYYGSTHDIYVVDVDGTHLKRLTDTPYEFERSPEWSPDGSRIAFTKPTHEPPYYHYSHDIYTMKPDGSDLKNVTQGGYNEEPNWAPDGSRLVFTRSNWGGQGVLSTIAADGSDYKDLVYTGQAPVYSPDGKKIAYTRSLPYPAMTTAIAVLPSGGGVPLDLITGAGDIAYESDWQALQTWPDYSSPKPQTPVVEVPAPPVDVPPVDPPADTPPGPPVDVAGRRQAYVATVVGDARHQLAETGLGAVRKGFTLPAGMPAPGQLRVDVLSASGKARAAAAKPKLLATGAETGSGFVKVKVRPTKAGRKAARKAKKLRVIVRLTFRPDEGPSTVSQTGVTLKR